MISEKNPLKKHMFTACLGLLLSGCSLPPSINVIGAYFPDWLFCMVGGVLAAVLARAVLVCQGMERALGAPVLVYSLLTVCFSLLCWLIVF